MKNQDNLAQSKEKTKEIAEFSIPGIDNAQDKYFKQITELQAGDVITIGNCKFCNHPLRSEAEQKWEQSKGSGTKGSYTMVINFLNRESDKYDGMTFSHLNVMAHLQNHYEQQVKRVHLRHYGRNLAAVMNYKISKEQMFEIQIQALHLKFVELGSNPELDPLKQASEMGRIAKTVAEIAQIQEKLRGDIDGAEIIRERLGTIIINYIHDEKDEYRKQLLMDQLDVGFLDKISTDAS